MQRFWPCASLSRSAPWASAMDEVLAEIRRVLREELALARDAQPDDDLVADLQLDSVVLLTLVVGLEDRFRVALREEDAATVRTVSDLAALVERRLPEACSCCRAGRRGSRPTGPSRSRRRPRPSASR